MKKVCKTCNQEFRVVRDRPDRVDCPKCVKKRVDLKSYHKNKHKWNAAMYRVTVLSPCIVCKRTVEKTIPESRIFEGKVLDPIYCGSECKKIRDREMARMRRERKRARASS